MGISCLGCAHAGCVAGLEAGCISAAVRQPVLLLERPVRPVIVGGRLDGSVGAITGKRVAFPRILGMMIDTRIAARAAGAVTRDDYWRQQAEKRIGAGNLLVL